LGGGRVQGRRYQPLLLDLMDLADAGGGRGRGSAAGIQHRSPPERQLLQAVADLIPGALVLRLFLTPDDLARVGIAVEDRLVLLGRERIELLNADQRNVTQSFLAARLEQIEVHLAAAEHHAPYVGRGELVGLADDAREVAAR